MRLVEHLQSKGEYAVYIPLRYGAAKSRSLSQNTSLNLDEYIFRFITLKYFLGRPTYFNSEEDDDMERFLRAHAARGKPVRLFIDDAEMLTKDSPCLGVLLELILRGQLRVVFITSNDDDRPGFLKSSGYSTRTETVDRKSVV